MQSMSLTLSKRLSNSKPLFRISSNLVAHASSATPSSPSPPPPSPPIPAPSALNSLLTAPWSATQSRGISLSGSDVRVGNLIGNRGRAHEVLKLYRSLEGKGKATLEVPPHSVAGYATVATTEDGTTRKERNSGLSKATKTKREQLLKATAVASLLLIYPNTYSLLFANFFVFWHLYAGIGEILADYVHHEMTREFVMISLRNDKESEELSLIRAQLVQIEKQQSSLLDLVKKFMGSSENGMFTLETRVHGLELALDEISYDLVVSSGRISKSDAPKNTCCLLPGAEFLSTKFWKKTQGRYSSYRFSRTGSTPLLASSHYRANRNAKSNRLVNHRFGVHGDGSFITNPLAEIKINSREVSGSARSELA